MMTFDQINDATGFANGDKWLTDEQIYDYFTVENIQRMFGDEATYTQDELDEMAQRVIENRWHMTESPAVSVLVGHPSSIAGARWCRPVGWSPRNRFDGADWSDEDGAWATEDGEAAGVVVFGHYDEGETVTVGLDDLRVAQSGDCRVIDEVQVDFE